MTNNADITVVHLPWNGLKRLGIESDEPFEQRLPSPPKGFMWAQERWIVKGVKANVLAHFCGYPTSLTEPGHRHSLIVDSQPAGPVFLCYDCGFHLSPEEFTLRAADYSIEERP